MLASRLGAAIFLLLVTTVHGLHFYLDANEKRCFIEELPSDTAVEGHYKALEWNEQAREYVLEPELGILVEVEVRLDAFHGTCAHLLLLITQEMETGHSVVKTRGPPEGQFTFSSHDAGDHSICLSTNYTSWFSSTHVKLYLDIIVGAVRPDIEHDRSHVSELASKVRDLNQKLEDIRREQQYQREREADFRDLSEATNTRAVWYSLLQIVVLVLTCTWQLKHLKRFFQDRS
ncbi:emp24/gp25L/p24 family/GOLD-domain-containing protein [Pisolithus croceorrhizus]|nr:emp24/gp25L/p24 family/GOLD-domain-containing protein [Pisolithus croceorrhizus]